MTEDLKRMEGVVDNAAEFERFILCSVSRMRAAELKNSKAIGPDKRIYERHYQVSFTSSDRLSPPM